MKSIINKSVLLIIAFLTFQLNGQSTLVSEGNTYSYSSNNNNGIHTIKVKSNGDDFKVEFEGDIKISDDDKDIEAISRGGYIEIKKSSFGRSRKIVIEAESGKLNKRYYVGWSEKKYNPDGKEWLAEVLPKIIRTTTIGAESRVQRFYQKGGVNAVLNEIHKMKSDYVQAAYYKLLLSNDIPEKDLQKVVMSAGENIKSDYYLASILSSNQQLFLSNPRSLTAYIDATESIESDYYLASVLSKAIESDEISDKELGELISVSKSLDSDYYLSSVLTSILNNRDLNKVNMERIMNISNNIGSDYYKSAVLKKALKKKNLSKENYQTFIRSIDDVDSDYYQSAIIKDFLNKNLDDRSLNELLELINTNVSSSYYAASLYKKLSRKKLSEKQLIKVLESASLNIDSSSYLASTLTSFAGQVKNSNQRVKDAYIKAAKRINSDTYFGKAMKAIY